VTRASAFLNYKDHPLLKKQYKKLADYELAIAMGFILDNIYLSKDDFERKAVRLFMDKPKPKHWKEIEELLLCANSALE
jgi:hypothetical protein